MGMLFGGGPKAPPPPPPPANPPTYASQASAAPVSTVNPFAGIGQSILTSPQGTADAGAVGRKTLLGQ